MMNSPNSARLENAMGGGFSPPRRTSMNLKRPTADPSRVLASLGYKPLGPIASGAFSTILRCKAALSDEKLKGCEVAVKSFDGAKCAREPTLAALRRGAS